MMIRIFAIITMFATASCTTIKPSADVHLYAYSRATIPGMIKKQQVEPGMKPVSSNARAIMNYFIYLEQTEPGMEVTRLWINGTPHTATLQQVDLPVRFETEGPGLYKKIDTLVAAGSQHVFRVMPDEVITGKFQRRKKKLAGRNAVIIEIKSGDKQLLGLSNEFKKLTPIVLQ